MHIVRLSTPALEAFIAISSAVFLPFIGHISTGTVTAFFARHTISPTSPSLMSG